MGELSFYSLITTTKLVKLTCVVLEENRFPPHGFDILLKRILPHRVLVGKWEDILRGLVLVGSCDFILLNWLALLLALL